MSIFYYTNQSQNKFIYMFVFKYSYYLVLLLLCLLTTPTLAASKDKPDFTAQELQKKIAQAAASYKAQVGVSIYAQGKEICQLNGRQQFPMLSVYKLHQALYILHFLEKNNLALNSPIYISVDNLRKETYSPLRDKYPQGNITLSLDEMLRYSLLLSDNNACDILFAKFGGPYNVNRYMQKLGMHHTNICWTEKDMHDILSRCYDNYTTPSEAALLLDKIVHDKIIQPKLQTWLKDTLIQCQTGQDRLASPLLSTGAVIGHKTGTGEKNKRGQIIGVNDIGFVILSNDGEQISYTLAVFIKNSQDTPERNAQLMATISELTYHYFNKK